MSGRDEELIDIIAEEALIDRAKLDPSAKLEDIGLDSLHLMEIALWVRKEYGVEVPEGDLRHDQTMREALAYLGGKAR